MTTSGTLLTYDNVLQTTTTHCIQNIPEVYVLIEEVLLHPITTDYT